MKIIFDTLFAIIISISFYENFKTYFIEKVELKNCSKVDEIIENLTKIELIPKLNETKSYKYWPIIIDKWNPLGNLRTHKRVLNRLGYEMVDGFEGDWSDVTGLLWSNEYPYDKLLHIVANKTFSKNLKLNHIPGIVPLINKRTLSLYSKSKYTLPAFRMPEDIQKFDNYVANNPKAKFVLKNFDNRGVSIKSVEEIRKMKLNHNRFIQVFLDDPFLVHGHAFDIGVYVLITSLDPLIIYRFKNDCLFRFCLEPYYPFDANNTNKYVVSNTKRYMWEMPPFLGIERQFPHLKLVEEVFESSGHDVKQLWSRLENAIVTTILDRYETMRKEFHQHCAIYKCINDNFFELLRFDFMVKNDGRVHLLEVNMSPSMTPNKPQYERHADFYEQVVYNALRVVGAEGFAMFKDDIDKHPMTSIYENLAVDYNNCKNCLKSCASPSCSHCVNCMPPDIIRILHKSHREHQRHGKFKRIFPSRVYENDTESIKLMTPKTKLLNEWFNNKCKDESEWC
ncbi:hypothetical protein PVAND_016643 [Polypedilum vanderplanki]|uniref:Uncharacterized protein n=1 Tax=Polypedilum vanderplanki TaxID=319348 RepID=A0A9J6BGS4_POLVA|nr:hypothetical protein PVAND_016643 [Polypedilum vanderplanki]